MDEYHKRIEEWREKVDPEVLRELNRRRVAEGHHRIRGLRRPTNGFVRYVYGYTYIYSSVEPCSSFFTRLRNESPRTEEDFKAHFKAAAGRASSQWRAMSDAEKAVRAVILDRSGTDH
jgi:hypothetical protein